MTVSVTIGGRAIAVPPLKFDALEVALEHMGGLQAQGTLHKQGLHALHIIAAGAGLKIEDLRKDMLASELPGLFKAVPLILEEAGLMTRAAQGESRPQPKTSTSKRSAR